jgi:hypothetical protein
MREYIFDDIINSLNFRNELGKPLYTTSVGFLTSLEVEHIEKVLGLEIKPITISSNLIVFKQNFKL